MIACAPDNGGLALPAGFCATVFADSIGHARHLTVSSDGTVYVNTWSGEYYGNDKPHAGGFLVALRDTTGDGRADVVARFGDSVQSGGHGGTGIALYKGALYAESNDKILRYTMAPGSVTPTAAPDGHHRQPAAQRRPPDAPVRDGLEWRTLHVERLGVECLPGQEPGQGIAGTRPLHRAGDPRRHLAVRPEPDGTALLSEASVSRRGSGTRSASATDASGQVYSTQHGRDQLAENWPKLYTPVQGQNFPSEVLLKIEQGSGLRLAVLLLRLDPGEAGAGAGVRRRRRQGDRGLRHEAPPTAYFPAHWAPNALAFYNAGNFPAAYRGGVFIAFHGSWNRAPGPQGGYNIVFVPFAGGKPSGPPRSSRTDSPGRRKEPGKAAHRPSGLAVGPGWITVHQR